MAFQTSAEGKISVKAIILGALCSIMATTLFTITFAWLINGETIKEEQISVISFVIRWISTLAGCAVCIWAGKGNALIHSLLSSTIYAFFLISITVLFFDGVFDSVISGISSILLGVVTIMIPVLIPKRKNTFKFKKFAR